MSVENLVLLRAELLRLSRRYNEGSEKASEMRKIERKINRLRGKIEKAVA